MASLRRVSYLLIILFFLDVSFIDHVATQCGVLWRPGGEDWANTWDGMVLFSCPKGKSIRRIHSIHRNCIEDRIWAFSCESNSAAQVCSWTGFVNSYDDLLNFKCPNNGFISGIYSVHSNKREDRSVVTAAATAATAVNGATPLTGTPTSTIAPLGVGWLEHTAITITITKTEDGNFINL
ncbi:hypothetical protein pdam_00012547, partial [Pocillopora damicornis]